MAMREPLPVATTAGVKVLASVGLVVKVAVALEVLPVPPLVEVTVPVVLA
jgi:hypothetical protein